MIIHAATVELLPQDLRMLRDSGLALGLDEPDRSLPIGRSDLAVRLRQARADTADPARRQVLVSFLKQLRA